MPRFPYPDRKTFPQKLQDFLAQVPEQTLGDRAVTRLARRQDQFKRQAVGVDERVDLGRQPAARAAHTAIRVAFFEFTAC